MDVNLLPPQEKANVDALIKAQHLKLYTLLTLLICAVFIGALAVFRTVQADMLGDVGNQISHALEVGPLSSYTQVEEQIGAANKTFSVVTALHDKRILWFDDFERVIELIPDEARMKGFEIDSSAQTITLFGFAPLRTQVTQLENDLKQLEDYVLIEAPLSNITKREDVNFSFRIRRITAFAVSKEQ